MQAVAVSLSERNWMANVVASPAVGIANAMKKAITTSLSMKVPGIRLRPEDRVDPSNEGYTKEIFARKPYSGNAFTGNRLAILPILGIDYFFDARFGY